MAWLSRIDGKTVSVLYSRDQKAASVLIDEAQEAELGSKVNPSEFPALGGSTSHVPTSSSPTPFLSAQSKQATSSQGATTKHLDNKSSEVAGSSTPVTSKAGDQLVKKKDTDDALFKFLNSSEPHERKKSTPGKSTRHSRPSSASSVISNKGGRASNGGQASSSTSGSSMVHVEMPGTDSRESPTDLAPDVEALEDAISSNSVHGKLESHSNQMNISSSLFDQKISMLENEFTFLNNVMALLVQRAKASQTELVKLKQKMAEQSHIGSKSDHVIRKLQNQEQDLIEVFGINDFLLAILEVRLEEAGREKDIRQRDVEQLQSERKRILRDYSGLSGKQGQALDSPRLKLTEVEDQLQREEEAHKRTKQEAVERQARLKEEQRRFTEVLTIAERKLSYKMVKITAVTYQIKGMRSSLDSAKQEQSEYKENATRMLQGRLKAVLRKGSEASGVSNLEYDTVKQERDMFKEENQKSRMTMDNPRLELSNIEAQLQKEIDTARETARLVERIFSKEKQYLEDFKQELLSLLHMQKETEVVNNYLVKTVALHHHTTCKDTSEDIVACVITILQELGDAFVSGHLMAYRRPVNLLDNSIIRSVNMKLLNLMILCKVVLKTVR